MKIYFDDPYHPETPPHCLHSIGVYAVEKLGDTVVYEVSFDGTYQSSTYCDYATLEKLRDALNDLLKEEYE